MSDRYFIHTLDVAQEVEKVALVEIMAGVDAKPRRTGDFGTSRTGMQRGIGIAGCVRGGIGADRCVMPQRDRGQ